MENPRYVDINVRGENKHKNEEELRPIFILKSIFLPNIVKIGFIDLTLCFSEEKIDNRFVNVKSIGIISVFQLVLQIKKKKQQDKK